MVKENHATLLLITNSTYYPIFFRHYLPNYYTAVSSASFTFEDLELIKPTCIIIDDQPFKETIFELCIQLRKRKAFQHTPLLIITGKLKRVYIQRLAGAGVNGFIREPLEEQDLVERIQDAEKFQNLGKKLGGVADTALHTPSPQTLGSTMQKLFLDKGHLEPFYATIKAGKPISLLAISVEYSDKHEFTEQQITQIIKCVINPVDLLIPLSHGKYVLILNHTPPKEALFIAETLRDVIVHTLHISITIGIASQKKPPYANIHDMIFDAKKALLTAEQKGVSIETNH